MEECFNVTQESVVPMNQTTATSISRIINKFALPSVCAFGVVGNILNLTILTRRKLQKSYRSLEQAANLCLIALALSDLMFCLMVIPGVFLPKDGRHSSENSLLALYHLYHVFIINIFIMESTLLTVAMSLERFMAICFPLRQDLYLTTRRIKYVIAFTVVFSVTFNIPVIFRSDMRCYHVFPNSSDSTLSTMEPPVASRPRDSLEYFLSSNRDLESRYDGSNADCQRGSKCLNRSGSVIENNLAAKESRSSVSEQFFDDLKLKSNSRTLVSPKTFISAVTTPGTVSSSDQHQRQVAHADNFTSSRGVNSSERRTYFIVEEIRIGNSAALDKAYRWAWAVAGNFVPLILLFYFNVCLWWRIYLSYKLRRQFHQAPRSSHILTLTLIAIVVMFFILVAPTETVLALKNNMTMERDTAMAIEHILNLMQAINFSVNFILYCIISPYFRKTLKYIMACGLYNVYQNTSSTKEWRKDFETSLM